MAPGSSCRWLERGYSRGPEGLGAALNEQSTIYWSSFNTYENCPQDFLWTYGWGDIDLGNGPGKAKTRPKKQSRHHAVMGIVTQYPIEKMYNDELWRDPGTLSGQLSALVESEWARQTKKAKNWIDYAEAKMSSSEMIELCKEGVVGYLQTMKAHKLLGEYARAEVELLGWINKWTAVGGRADLIIRRADTGISLLDGKNTRFKMTYTDPDQLRWYAMVFYLTWRKMPDRIGFVWYRFPYGGDLRDEDGALVYAEGSDTPMVEQGVEWIPFTEDDLRGIAQRAVAARNGMRKKKFAATPAPSKCKFCEFETVCEERQAQIKKNSATRNANRSVDELKDSFGFVDLTL